MIFLKWEEIIKVILRANLNILALAFLLHLIGLLISVFRWNLLLKAIGIKKGLTNLLVIYWVSLFYNLFLPTSIGGDVVRVYDLSFTTGKLEKSLASVVMDRLTGMIVLLIIGLWALLFNVKLYNAHLLFWTIAFLVFFLSLFIMLIYKKPRKIFYLLMPSKILNFFKKKLNKYIDSFNYYKINPKALIIAMFYGALLQINVIIYFFLIGKALKIKLDFVYYCAVIPIIQIITLIPVSLSGIGIREAAMITILKIFNVSPELSFSLSLLSFILAAIFNSIGGLLQFKLYKRCFFL